MRISAIFWLIIIVAIHIIAYKLGIVYLFTCYCIWSIIGIIIHNMIKEISIIDFIDYNDNLKSEQVFKLFMNYPYLFSVIHLLFIGLIISIAFIFEYIYKYIVSFNTKLDNLKNIKLKEKRNLFLNIKTIYKNKLK